MVGGTFTAAGDDDPFPQQLAVWSGSTFSVPPLDPMPKYDHGLFDHRMAALQHGC
ncbi:MAG: hypothetical protein JNJ64_07460 [Flavobacteriales bacterium]|nr:hypothetical protein [Flavobacteriales bacterium]